MDSSSNTVIHSSMDSSTNTIVNKSIDDAEYDKEQPSQDQHIEKGNDPVSILTSNYYVPCYESILLSFY